MTYGRVLCQVVETPAQDFPRDNSPEWMPSEQDWPRDLLPWADPYIAVLMLRLERRYDWADGADWADEADESLFAGNNLVFQMADEMPPSNCWQDGFQDSFQSDFQDDAFTPGWHERRMPMFPPIYGGFPLLDDVTDGLEEDPV